MRTVTDALRSVARYTSVALGPDYEVRMAQEKGTFNRPYARVVQVPNIQLVTQRWDRAKLIASYNIVAYPVPGVNADASLLAAMDVAEKLWLAFAGPGVGNPTMRRQVDSNMQGRPSRVPLYDYAGVPLDGPAAFVDETRRDPRDFMRVEGAPEVSPFADPDDERLFSVAANIRMSWMRFAAVPSSQPTVSDVPVGADTNG
jgi:hypothetical protein